VYVTPILSTVSLPVMVSLSHVVFHIPLVITITTRYILAASQTPVSSWSLDVCEWLFLLISYFLHMFRPLLVFILEPELRLGLRLGQRSYTAVVGRAVERI